MHTCFQVNCSVLECVIAKWLCPPAGGGQEMGGVYLGASQVVVTTNLKSGGRKCHGVMHVHKKYVFSKSRILQAVQPRPQPSESCVPMSSLQAVMGSPCWHGRRCLEGHLMSAGCRDGARAMPMTFPAPHSSVCSNLWCRRWIRDRDFSLAMTIWQQISVHNLQLF